LGFVVLVLAAALSSGAFAQSDSPPDAGRATSPTEETEEITVRGRKTLTEYRLELEEAREELIAVFNEENSSANNDVTCRDERPTGSRMPQRVWEGDYNEARKELGE
jgi:hypothetical protein